jgi:hypothetical protein
METFQLSGGDLVPGAGGYQTITGSQKITQDIGMALGEPYGFDPYHATWGSYLPSWQGRPVLPSSTPALVSAEVSRVLAGLIAAQQAQITITAASGVASAYATGDVISSVQSVDATADADSVVVSLALATQAGAQIAVTRTVAAS